MGRNKNCRSMLLFGFSKVLGRAAEMGRDRKIDYDRVSGRGKGSNKEEKTRDWETLPSRTLGRSASSGR